MQKNLNASRYLFSFEDQHLPIIIRKHPSSRRIVIRYQPLKHVLSVTLPRYASIKQGLHFVEEKRDWVTHEVGRHAKKQPLADGAEIPMMGKRYRIRHTGGRGIVRIEGEDIIVPGEAEFTARRLRDFLTKQVKTEISRLSQAYAQNIGKQVKKITVRDTSSHWGSCSHDGSLSFSWRLVFAPYEVLDYIVCHEVAHIAEHNHSPAFWRVVGTLCPEWRKLRNWVKIYGSSLYAYN